MTSLFVNFATDDLERSKAFYIALGATINPNFTDENAACVVWDENVYFMVLTREYFSTFTDKEIIDAKTHAQVSLALSRDSREDVDKALEAGLAAGGSEPRPVQDYGFMYTPRPRRPGRQQPRLPLHGPGGCRKGTRGVHGGAGRAGLSVASRSYGQYCGVTTAVELIGERWAMLIVRDLLVGPRRYTDLKQGLPKIPTNILSVRLKELQEGGVVRRVPAQELRARVRAHRVRARARAHRAGARALGIRRRWASRASTTS